MKRVREPVDVSLLVNDDDIDFVDGVYVVRKKQSNSSSNVKDKRETRVRANETSGGGRRAEEGGCGSSNAETLTAIAPSSSLSSGSALYAPRVNMKNAAVCKWTDEPHSHLLEIVKMRGNFWRNNGFSHSSRNYLYAEEAMLLAEKGSIVVLTEAAVQKAGAKEGRASRIEGGIAAPDSAICEGKVSSSGNGNERSRNSFDYLELSAFEPLSEIFARALPAVPIPVYLTFSKLKSLEYMVTRHNRAIVPPSIARSGASPLKSFGSAQAVRQLARALSSGEKLLDAVVSFDIFVPTLNWSKKNALSASPVGHVVVTTSTKTLPADLMLRLLDEAAGVPVLMAAVMSSGYVMLEEFTNAITALDWANEFADDNDTAKIFIPADSAGTATALDSSLADAEGEVAEIDGADIDNGDIDDDEM